MAEDRDSNGPRMPGWAIILILLAGAIAFGVLLSTCELIANAAEIVSQGPFQAIQPQIDDLRQQVEELKNRVDSLVHNRIPVKMEFCGETVPQERIHVRERLDKEITLLSRKQFTLYIKRATYKYFPYIEKRLKEWRMPDCLKYVAVIESAMLPNALSSAKAYGMWQFIPSTGRRYGLKQNSGIDERANFEKATDAAFTYLWDNCQIFKNLGAKNCWPLAMAAYNVGEAAVEKAVRQQRTTDFYNLWLPAEETRQYVYRAIVAKLVMSDPKTFGLSLKDSDMYQWPDIKEVTIALAKPKSIINVTVSLGVSVPEFLLLNPQYSIIAKGKKSKNNYTVLPKGTYKFKVPSREE